MKQNKHSKNNLVETRLAASFPEMSGADFYAELFPDCESSGDTYADYSHPNAIYLWKDGEGKVRRRVMLKDTWDEDYLEFVHANPLALCGGLTYRGRANTLENAQRMVALIMDLDGVGDEQLVNLLFARFGQPSSRLRSLPMPTYIAASGTGLHIYYVFEQPIDLYPVLKPALKRLKDDLTYKLWDYKSTTTHKEIQYQSLNQGFRMVGSINTKYGNTIRAFRTGEKVTIDILNDYCIKAENRVDLNTRPKGKVSLSVAAALWPDWYERKIVQKQKTATKWDVAGKVHGKDPYALYHWWLRRVGEVRGGHRYFYMMCLVAYARKCDLPYKTLKSDIEVVYQQLRAVEHTSPLTEDDMKAALKFWKKDLYNLPIDEIERMSGLSINRNKRNGRRQEDHLRRARAVESIDYPKGEWRNKEGRPTKQKEIAEWREAHPEGRKIDCERELGLSRHTVLKWWNPPIPSPVLGPADKERTKAWQSQLAALYKKLGADTEHEENHVQ